MRKRYFKNSDIGFNIPKVPAKILWILASSCFVSVTLAALSKRPKLGIERIQKKRKSEETETQDTIIKSSHSAIPRGNMVPKINLSQLNQKLRPSKR